MSQKDFDMNTPHKINMDGYTGEDIYTENYQEFLDYDKEMVKNNGCGFYHIYAFLSNGNILKHKFIFIDRRYNKLTLAPVEIPDENMFNTTQTIIKKEYKYESVNISDYHTTSKSLVDFDGTIRKKEENDEIVNVNKTNFLVKSEKDYNLKKYLKEGELLSIHNFEYKYQRLINRSPIGLYEIVIILNTGEHLKLYYRYNTRDSDYIKVLPFLKENIKRNMHNIPEEHIKVILYKFYPVSKRIHGNRRLYLSNLESYTNHMYESNWVGKYIIIPTDIISNNILSAIQKFGNEGKIVYSFNVRNGHSITTQREIYEFVKFRKKYQTNDNFIILKTRMLPKQSWNETELTDILSEKWEYVIG